MAKFPLDVPVRKIVKSLERLGFDVIRGEKHISLVRNNSDGTRTPLTIPNHRRIKGSTLRSVLTQAGIPREEFLKAYEEA